MAEYVKKVKIFLAKALSLVCLAAKKTIRALKIFWTRLIKQLKNLFQKFVDWLKCVCVSFSDKLKALNRKQIAYLSCLVFSVLVIAPFLIINVVIIAKGSLDKGNLPFAFGKAYFIQQSDDMLGTLDIKNGDLVVVKAVTDKTEITADYINGSVVIVRENNNFVLTRLVATRNDDGATNFITKTDASKNADIGSVSRKNVVGVYKKSISGVGGFAMFMQTPAGVIIFMVIPLLGFIVGDYLAYRKEVFAKVKLLPKETQSNADDKPKKRLVVVNLVRSDGGDNLPADGQNMLAKRAEKFKIDELEAANAAIELALKNTPSINGEDVRMLPSEVEKQAREISARGEDDYFDFFPLERNKK